jgi:hypothetical protein
MIQLVLMPSLDFESLAENSSSVLDWSAACGCRVGPVLFSIVRGFQFNSVFRENNTANYRQR